MGLTLAALVVPWPGGERQAVDETAAEPPPRTGELAEQAQGERQAVDEATAEGLWLQHPDAAFAQAAAEDRPLVIVFHADWCPVCQRMERTTFQDAEVVERLRSVVPLKADVDEQQDLADRFGVTALPTTVVVTPAGETVTFKLGYLDAMQFLALLPEPKAAFLAP